jgi:hypothetical protein
MLLEEEEGHDEFRSLVVVRKDLLRNLSVQNKDLLLLLQAEPGSVRQ